MRDTSHILDGLNETQREAVSAPAGHTLVLAGAGSGKTRVLVHRIAWLVETGMATPGAILAVTFTNKAATEMRTRIEAILGRSLGSMWVGTFHGLAHRMLRLHWRDTNLPEGFQIMDSEDQLRMVRRVIRNMGLDESEWQPKQAQWFINTQKDEGLRARHLEDRDDNWMAHMCRIYQDYEKACMRSGLVDFPELLLRSHELLRDQDNLLTHYQMRFAHLLVDELQDTNSIQYAWIRLIVGNTGKLFMVGDDDQSIYGWRGAKIENIHRFPSDFPGVNTIRLERNYRSTGNILAAANAVIANNRSRLGKSLWTSDADGAPVQLYVAFNEQEEAKFVAAKIAQWLKDRGNKEHVAVLYRVSAQSRVFEEKLLENGISYRVHGGLRFYERAEIKDALAYLRLIMNRHDDTAIERVINQPPRGIGIRTVEAIRQKSRTEGVSLWAAAELLRDEGELTSRTLSAIGTFLRLINSLASDFPVEEDGSVNTYRVVDETVRKSGLLNHYKTDKSDRAEARVENLEELVSAVRQFDRGASRETMAADGSETRSDLPESAHSQVMLSLSEFLSHAALEAGESSTGDANVHLMTIHAAKGLEFPLVFLCGLEEGLFPHQRNVSGEKLEEERRLCYVGMTRAEKLLYISYAENRRLHGSDYFQRPSRFIGEIPSERIHEVQTGGVKKGYNRQYETTKKSAPQRRKTGIGSGVKNNQVPWPPGHLVVHPTFGKGVIRQYEGHDAHMRVEVNFQNVGTKWLVLTYARLESGQ